MREHRLKTIDEVMDYLINRPSVPFKHELEWRMLRMFPHKRYEVDIWYGIEMREGGTFTGGEMIQALEDVSRMVGL